MGLDGAAMATDATAPRGAAAITSERLLFIWLSPSFPVGAYAYSQGLEMAVERGLVTSRATLEDWLATLIAHGSLRNDLILLVAAYRYAAARDRAGLVAANALACALQPSAERHLETTQQGGSFLTAIAGAWSTALFDETRGWLEDAVSYPVAVGVAAAAHGITMVATTEAFAFAWASNLTSAAIRLSVVGQSDAQTVIASLAGALSDAALSATTQTLDEIGGAAFSADLASLEHETQYSRLFRS
jgi:urease accessory protein